MKRFLKIGSLSLVIVMLLVGTVFGAGVKEMIEARINSIHVTVNGENVNADNIVHRERTYIPLRAVSEMLDKDVEWDQVTQTASINDKVETAAEKALREQEEKDKEERLREEIKKELAKEQPETIVPVIIMSAVQGELEELKMLGTPNELYELNISRPRRANLLKDWDWRWNWNAHIVRANRYGEIVWAINPDADLGTYDIEITGDTKLNLKLTITEPEVNPLASSLAISNGKLVKIQDRVILAEDFTGPNIAPLVQDIKDIILE